MNFKKLDILLPGLALILTLIFVGYWLKPQAPPQPYAAYDLAAFGRLPALHDGRVKPLEAVARHTLLILRTRQALRTDTQTIPAIVWMLDAIGRPELAGDYPVFRVDDPDLRALLEARDDQQVYFSLLAVRKHADVIMRDAQQAAMLRPEQRDLYQKHVLILSDNLNRYRQLVTLENPYLFPPATPAPSGPDSGAANLWRNVADITALRPDQPAPAIFEVYRHIISAWNDQNPADFNAAVHQAAAILQIAQPTGYFKAGIEAHLLIAEPFLLCITLYLLAFLLTLASFLTLKQPLWRSAMVILLITVLLHTLALAVRVYLHGRPPVTNLYASAVFVGWAGVILGLILELIYRQGIGALTAAVVGLVTLIIAHNLPTSSGDTMEAMRAVLDSNGWLATHVIAITLGYSACFVAGLLATIYVLGAPLPVPLGLPAVTRKALAQATYGILCFATLLSFVGTVLGGIWADQSWGRFWGWDPKENGALMIVLWCAIILHARWAGLIKERGLMVLAIGGNIVTAWSWFGVNMLGAGLHAYGFMDKAAIWLVGYMLSQLMLMALGILPVVLYRPEPGK